MKKHIVLLLFAVMIAWSLFQTGCAGAYVGMSAPIGYPTWGGGGSVSIGVGGPGMIGRPVVY